MSNPAFSRRGDFLDYDPDVFEKVLKGTLFGGFHMSQLVARHMVARGGGGKIVFVSSVHARIPFARSVAYNAAKIGLTHMARTIAAELLPHRINVNVIEPGWIDTPGEHATFGSETDRAGRPDRCRGAGSARPRTSAARRRSSARTTPTTSPARKLVVDGGLCLRGAGGASATEQPQRRPDSVGRPTGSRLASVPTVTPATSAAGGDQRNHFASHPNATTAAAVTLADGRRDRRERRRPRDEQRQEEQHEDRRRSAGSPP